MRGNQRRGKRCVWVVVKYDANDVVSNVSLSVELLGVVFVVWQQRGNMEHDLVATKIGVIRRPIRYRRKKEGE